MFPNPCLFCVVTGTVTVDLWMTSFFFFFCYSLKSTATHLWLQEPAALGALRSIGGTAVGSTQASKAFASISISNNNNSSNNNNILQDPRAFKDGRLYDMLS